MPEHFLDSSRQRTPTNKPLTPAQPAAASTSSKSSLNEVLAQLPDVHDVPQGERKKPKRRLSKKWVKRGLIALALIILLVGGYIGVKFFIASGRVFNGNIFSLLDDGKPLQVDQYGRANILIYGTSEDDPEHAGADLTDSIMIASINPTTKDAFMVSIPRDLWVKYGRACSAGYEGRINVVYQCGKGEGDDQTAGANLLKSTLERDFGMTIQYHAQVNYTALKDTVNAVGGVTVQIESDDPRGILDRNFDWKCGYQCNYVKYPNGPATLDGEHALALARARNAAGGYGLGGGNFDREEYQQKIIVALREKASSAGVLANPVSVTKLLDALGNNVRTNFETGEIKTLIKLAQEIDSAKIKRVSLVDEEKPLVTTANISGQSIVQPLAGTYDFSEIKATLKAYLSNDTALLEGAVIDVLNGSGVPGVAQTRADELEEAGYTIGAVSNAPAGEYGVAKLYDVSDGKMPGTKAKLQQRLGVTASAANTLPAGITTDADFVIIIGSNGSN